MFADQRRCDDALVTTGCLEHDPFGSERMHPFGESDTTRGVVVNLPTLTTRMDGNIQFGFADINADPLVSVLTSPSARLNSRVWPGLVDAGSRCGPGNCSGSLRAGRADLALSRPAPTESDTVCPARCRRAPSLAPRSLERQSRERTLGVVTARCHAVTP